MSHYFKLAYKNYRKTRIFGENFVKRNKNKFKIVYNNKEYALKEFFEEIDDKFKPGIKIKFKLRIFHNILNLSEMFFNCYGLLAMKDDAKVNKEQVKAKSKYGLSISKKEEKKSFKIIDINRMFFGCYNLKSIPDISDWNMENVTNMFGLFYECESLISIPDISKWNMKKVTNINYIFYGCNKLSSIPDITNWNVENIFYYFELVYKYDNHLRILGKEFVNKNINECYIEYNFKIFRLCEIFKKINDKKFKKDEKIKIYLKFQNEIDMSCMFASCDKLLSVNFIGNIRDTIEDTIIDNKENELSSSLLSNRIDMNLDDKYDNFYGDYTLLNTTESKIEKNYSSFLNKTELSRINNLLCLPKITVTNMERMFYECKSLISLPDLSNWNTNKVEYMNRMFSGCESLISLPDLSNWNRFI